eukprot:5018900-Pyramimonas_sp.AAC.2
MQTRTSRNSGKPCWGETQTNRGHGCVGDARSFSHDAEPPGPRWRNHLERSSARGADGALTPETQKKLPPSSRAMKAREARASS